MSWTSRNPRKASIIVTIAGTVFLLGVLEAISSVAYYQKKRPNGASVSSTVRFVQYLLNGSSVWGVKARATSKYDKFDEFLRLEQRHSHVYPNYLHTPQLHLPGGFYHLANVRNSLILDCNESGFFSTWTSDEIGFRNQPGTVGKDSDFLLIGDSFTEGACEREAGTIAGFLRESGFAVVNLGRGGSGPLHQLATLVEYGAYINSKEVIWIVFTGNDLSNLREEKTTKLSRYMAPGFTQSLFIKADQADGELGLFLQETIRRNKERKKIGISFPKVATYGETLDEIEAAKSESYLLRKVAQRILEETNKQGKSLRIVVLNHYTYNYSIQDITSRTLRDFSELNDVPLLELSRSYLRRARKSLYTANGPHFSAEGYRKVGGLIRDWYSRKSKVAMVIK